MGIALAISIICLPFVEIFLAIEVAHQIGVAPTLALLLVLSLSGPWLVKHHGAGVWNRARARVQDGKVPGRELTDGAFVLASGILLTVPGFLTAALGILLLLPPVRAVVRWAGASWIGRSSLPARGAVRVYTDARWRQRSQGSTGTGTRLPIDAAARDDEPSRPPLGTAGEP